MRMGLAGRHRGGDAVHAGVLVQGVADRHGRRPVTAAHARRPRRPRAAAGPEPVAQRVEQRLAGRPARTKGSRIPAPSRAGAPPRHPSRCRNGRRTKRPRRPRPAPCASRRPAPPGAAHAGSRTGPAAGAGARSTGRAAARARRAETARHPAPPGLPARPFGVSGSAPPARAGMNAPVVMGGAVLHARPASLRTRPPGAPRGRIGFWWQ